MSGNQGMDAPDQQTVKERLRYHRGLIARMTPEQRQRLRDSLRPEEAVADGDLSPSQAEFEALRKEIMEQTSKSRAYLAKNGD